MEPSELDALLGLMQDLHGELDRYLTGAASSSVAIPRIRDMCAQMRTKGLSEAAKFWLGAVESHVTEISSPGPRPGSERNLLTSSVFLGTQLLKDAHLLRAGLVNGRDSIN